MKLILIKVMRKRPKSRAEFSIALICALSLEHEAIKLIFDEFWDEDGNIYGKAVGDMNSYRNGRIGQYNVVLARLPGIGTNAAASATTSLCSSYTNLDMGILIGICGAVPSITGHEVFLGDVVIGSNVIQYDNGKQYPSGFQTERIAITKQPTRAVTTWIANFESESDMKRLGRKSQDSFVELQSKAHDQGLGAYYQPRDAAQDVLYQGNYVHKHTFGCQVCRETNLSSCNAARKMTCEELGCNSLSVVRRNRCAKKENQQFQIFLGNIGSGNKVIKSGVDRDQMAKELGVIAFEMEGAGLCDDLPCIIVKGISDYADSHKNDSWQNLAAANAASVLKAMLERYTPFGKIKKRFMLTLVANSI